MQGDQLTSGEIPSTSKDKRPMPFPVFRELSLLAGVLVSVFFLPYLYTQAHTTIASTGAPAQNLNPANTATEETGNVPKRDAFSHLSLLGKSSVVYDVARNEFLYESNPDEPLPIASVAKLMTALIVYELMESLDVPVTIPSSYSLKEYRALRAGDAFLAKDLLAYTLLVSSNEGAVVLAEAAAKEAFGKQATMDDFVRAMNIRAQSLGLTETFFKNATGLDIDDHTAGAVSSAHDIAYLMAYITTSYPDLLTVTATTEKRLVGEAGYFYDARNTNGVAEEIPGLIASKTGFETLAGGTLAVAFDAGLGRTIVVVVLGSTRNGRFDDILQLVKTTREAL